MSAAGNEPSVSKPNLYLNAVKTRERENSLVPLPNRPAVTENALVPVVLATFKAPIRDARPAMDDARETRIPETRRAGPARVAERRAEKADIWTASVKVKVVNVSEEYLKQISDTSVTRCRCLASTLAVDKRG